MATRVVIIEDEAFASRRLSQLLATEAPGFEVLAVLDSVETSRNWFASNPLPDLIFLDIQLNDGYGFDVLDALGESPPVIFTTAYNEYALRGFKYNGLDYLLKPIVAKELRKACEKYLRQWGNRELPTGGAPLIDQMKQLFQKEYKSRFMVKVGQQFKWFQTSEIACFRAEEGVITLVLHSGKAYPIEYSLDQLEEILNPLDFFRVNRAVIVSIGSVREVHAYFNSRLLIRTEPPMEPPVVVARERATKFKRWLDT